MKYLWFLLALLSCAPPPAAPPPKGALRFQVTFPASTSLAQRDSIHADHGCTLEMRNEQIDIVRVNSPIWQPAYKKYLRCPLITFFEPLTL